MQSEVWIGKHSSFT